ncbi:MAG TPA: DUF1259 domain-containing protein [Gemmatimonadales bacterium]|jgi:hypothetical protein
MRIRTAVTISIAIAGVLPMYVEAQSPFDPVRDTVAAILGAPPADGGGYTRYTLPRTDLNVMVGDVKIAPALALGSWAGFAGTPARAEAMGDIIATESELPKVLHAIVAGHLDVAAIHDHLNGETPRLAYIHFHGSGSAVDLATRVNSVMRVTEAPHPGAHPPANSAVVTIDTAQVFRVLGLHSRASGAVASLSAMLVAPPVTVGGNALVPALAYGTSIAIQQVTPARAVATGDFAMTAGQVQPVIRALTAAGITATALHTHLIGASPEIYFLHFWGDAPLPALLQGIRNALSAAEK